MPDLLDVKATNECFSGRVTGLHRMANLSIAELSAGGLHVFRSGGEGVVGTAYMKMLFHSVLCPVEFSNRTDQLLFVCC